MRYARDSRQRRHHHPEGHEFPHPHRQPHHGGAEQSGQAFEGRERFARGRRPEFPGFGEPGFEGHPGHPGHRGRGGWDGRGRGRGRAGRGDVRAATLILLNEQPMHGYQLMQAMADRTNGVWRPSPGAIYPTIAQLEDEGLVTDARRGRPQAGHPHRRRPGLLADEAGTLADPFAALAGTPGQSLDLRSALEEVHAATRVVGRTGDEAQVAAAPAVLGDARRALYLILAEGDQPRTPPAESGSCAPDGLTGRPASPRSCAPSGSRHAWCGWSWAAPGWPASAPVRSPTTTSSCSSPSRAATSPRRRTYTVRRWDEAAGELTLDFVSHGDEGLAGPWAAAAVPGDQIALQGPGGEYAPDPAADWHLFAGDASALPAIAARSNACGRARRPLRLSRSTTSRRSRSSRQQAISPSSGLTGRPAMRVPTCSPTPSATPPCLPDGSTPSSTVRQHPYALCAGTCWSSAGYREPTCRSRATGSAAAPRTAGGPTSPSGSGWSRPTSSLPDRKES